MGKIHNIFMDFDFECCERQKKTKLSKPFIHRFKLKSCDQVSSAVQRFILQAILYGFIVVLVFFFLLLASNKRENQTQIDIELRSFRFYKQNFFIGFHLEPKQLIPARVWSKCFCLGFVWTINIANCNSFAFVIQMNWTEK